MGQGSGPSGITHLRVYFADTDQMGVVYNGVYLTWFEIGRTELLRDRGLSYAEVERRGLSLPVTEVSFKIRRPARYDDWITVETAVSAVRTREVRFHYRIFEGVNLLVEGETSHVPVSKADGRASRVPDWLVEQLS